MYRWISLNAFLIFVFTASAPATAEAKPACTPKYIGQLLLQPDANGRSMTLNSPFAYEDKTCIKWQVPKKAAVDGASIPRVLWTVIGGPWDGPYRDASVIHDWFCAVRTRPWKDVHRMFYEAMLTSGVRPKLARVMYLAVYYGGPRWDEITVRNSTLANSDRRVSSSVSQALVSVQNALATGNLAVANSALMSAQSTMTTAGDQYAVARTIRTVSVAVNDKVTEGAAVDAMISSGIPDEALLASLYSERATIAYEQGDKASAVKNARAALDLNEASDAVDLLAALSREATPSVEGADSTFDPNPVEFKRLANIVEQQNLDVDDIEQLVDQVRQ